MKKILVLVAGIVILMAQSAVADEFEVCQGNCTKKSDECLSRISSPNDIEIQDLRRACRETKSVCDHYCDGRSENPYQAEEEKAAREKQEPAGSGGIKTFEFK
ncbi:MAG TPA: hypothetical protein VIK40_07335 [Geomonas sp.]